MPDAGSCEQSQRLLGGFKSGLSIMKVRAPRVREPVDELPRLFGGRLEKLSSLLLACARQRGISNHFRPSQKVGVFEIHGRRRRDRALQGMDEAQKTLSAPYT